MNVFPRAMRWKFPENGGTLDNFDLTASRCQLDYVDDESKVSDQTVSSRVFYIQYIASLNILSIFR